MLELRQPRGPAPGALCRAAVCLVCAGTALLSACRSNGAPTGPGDDAAPAREHAAVSEHDAAPKQDVRASKTPSKLYRIGDTASTQDYRLRVEHIKHCETEPYFRPRQGNVKLGVKVTLESTAVIPVMINPFYAWVSDSRGKSYYFTLAGCEPILQATRLQPEQEVDGWLTFEVPENANDLELRYRPPAVSGAPHEVRFSLRRE
jgi:hypothetical protein